MCSETLKFRRLGLQPLSQFEFPKGLETLNGRYGLGIGEAAFVNIEMMFYINMHISISYIEGLFLEVRKVPKS